MPIWEEICRAEQKYMPFFGTVAERHFWKKNPKHRNIYKSSQCCAPDFFSAKDARWWSRVLDFFSQDSRIRVNGRSDRPDGSDQTGPKMAKKALGKKGHFGILPKFSSVIFVSTMNSNNSLTEGTLTFCFEKNKFIFRQSNLKKSKANGWSCSTDWETSMIYKTPLLRSKYRK